MSNQSNNDANQEARSQHKPHKIGGVSRRGFLTRAGLTAAGAAIVEGGLLNRDKVATQDAPQVVGPIANACLPYSRQHL